MISLKLGAIIMLLRNLNPADGHCNGTRYVVTNMAKHVLEEVIPDGIHPRDYKVDDRLLDVPNDEDIVVNDDSTAIKN